jgi:membrane-bound ClpP family serine protease
VDPESFLGWGIVLIGVACALIFIEVFIPSGGLIAIGSAISASAGIIMLFKYDTTWGVIGLMATLILGPMALTLGFKMFPHTPLGRRMILGSSQQDPREVAEHRDSMQALIGTEGEAVSDLRPIGVVRIDGERHDALAEGPMIEAGSRVRVVVVEANQIKVRKID